MFGRTPASNIIRSAPLKLYELFYARVGVCVFCRERICLPWISGLDKTETLSLKVIYRPVFHGLIPRTLIASRMAEKTVVLFLSSLSLSSALPVTSSRLGIPSTCWTRPPLTPYSHLPAYV